MDKRGIFLTSRHVSWMLSFFIISSFFVFIAGYFFGKKRTVEKFYNKIDQDSLADHIYYSVCSIYDNNEEAVKQESTEESSSVVAKVAVASNLQQPQNEQVLAKSKVSQEHFYAELIGFGTARAAQRFVAKLKQQGFSVVLRRRKSRSSKGKTIVWYQVITEKFDNKSDLIAFVDIIKDKERLKGVRIVQC